MGAEIWKKILPLPEETVVSGIESWKLISVFGTLLVATAEAVEAEIMLEETRSVVSVGL